MSKNKKKINIIGSSLYALFLAYHLSKNKNNEITVYEKSAKPLSSFDHIKIKGMKLNPGFHSFEKKRSKLLINFLKKNFGVKFLEIKKGRGLIIDRYLIDETTDYKNWPKNILRLYRLTKKKVNYKINQILSKKEKKYCSYLIRNLGSKLDYLSTMKIIYPWFFPSNYSIDTKDEGLKNLNLIRKRKFVNTYCFPKNLLFESLGRKVYKVLKKKRVKFKFNSDIKFYKNKNLKVVLNNKNIEGLNIVCLPLVSIISSLQNYRFKLMKFRPHELFTAVIKTQNITGLEEFTEIIISSQKLKYLRRISKINNINSNTISYYQIEFIRNKKINNLNQQIKNYTNSLSEILSINQKFKKKIKFELEGSKFVRFVFTPSQKTLKNLILKFKKYLKTDKKLLIPRYITWPINTNKQYFYSISDEKLIRKL